MLYRAFLLLATSFFLAMDGTMAQWTTGAVTSRIVTDTVTSPTVTYLEVSFYHESGVSATYEDSYYYSSSSGPAPSCGALVPSPTPGLTDIPPTAIITDPIPVPSPGPENSSCGVNGGEPCTQKTTYRYKLQDLNALDSNFKTTTNPTLPALPETTVVFCVRNSLVSNTIVYGFRTAHITAKWRTDSDFSDTVTTVEEGPTDVGDLDVGDITAKAAVCGSVGSTPSYVYEQGEKIQICIWAEVNNANAAVVIVDVNQFQFWIDAETTPNNVFNSGEVNQIGIVNGATTTSGTTVVIPAGAINGGNELCNVPFNPASPGTVYIPGSTYRGCVLETFLGSDFFKSTNTIVRYSGIVTIQFSSTNNRRSLALKNGDTFAKTFGSVVNTASRATEDDSCECSGFFFLFCLAMCFIMSLLG